MFKDKKNLVLIIIIGIFIISRFLGVGQPYHQDEYRWATIVDPSFEESVAPHPPVNKIALYATGVLFGFDNLKFAPFIFSLFNLILLYLIVAKLTGNKMIGYIAASLFTISTYSLIANLQLDIDGAVLPFFILLTYYGYINLSDSNRAKYLILFLIGIIGGLLSKLSFVIFLAALAIDFVIKSKIGWRKVINWSLALVGFVAISFSALYLFFNVREVGVISYGLNFQSFNFASRAYFQLFFKLVKSVIWLSPLLLLPVIYGLFKKDILSKHAVWFIYLVLNLVFYLVLFDFARLTIERYFMFFIVPSVIISSIVIYEFIKNFNWKKNYIPLISLTVLFIGLSLFILSQAHEVLPLNPKIEYINHLKSVNLNFLIPFTGGSGPVGFYHSASFIFWSWLGAVVLFLVALTIKKIKYFAMLAFLVLGLVYNVFLSSEYLFGSAFGSVPNITKKAVNYIKSDESIDSVITYYDAGAYYLRQSGQYASRFYTAPSRDYTKKLSTYDGHYMIVDFPMIDKKGRYWPYLERCEIVKKFTDKKIDAYIFNCQNI